MHICIICIYYIYAINLLEFTVLFIISNPDPSRKCLSHFSFIRAKSC